MKRLRLPAALAVVTFAVSAAPLAAQQPADELFTSYLAAAGSIATPVVVPSTTTALTSVDRASDDESVPATMTASTSHMRLYLLGGAALAAGTVYALQSGSSGTVALASSTPAPVHTGSPPAVFTPASAPGISPPIFAANPTVTMNPEPATMLLMVTGLLGVGAVARRRRRAA